MSAIPHQSVYAERRARLAAQLGAGGVAIVPTAPERQRNRDSEYLFRFDSYFYYLTGFTRDTKALAKKSLIKEFIDTAVFFQVSPNPFN